MSTEVNEEVISEEQLTQNEGEEAVAESLNELETIQAELAPSA